MALRPHILLAHAGQFGEPGVGKTQRLDAAHAMGGFRQTIGANGCLGTQNDLQLLDEPGIDGEGGVDILWRKAKPQCLGHFQQTVRCR